MNTHLEQDLAALAADAPDGFVDRVMVATGLTPTYAVVEGPIGPLWVVWGVDGVTDAIPVIEESHLLAVLERRGVGAVPGRLPEHLARSIHRSLETGRLGTLPVDLSRLTDFQRAVLTKTAEIPPGEMRPYGWVAKEIGNPGSVRAVGSALNKNPVPVLIPCHRVSRSDGHVGDYAYGPEMKRALLRTEGADPAVLDEHAAAGVRYSGSDTTKIYCFPTCRHARRTTTAHGVTFASRSEAEAAGYRGCKVCRPAA
jgi:O-6-methylguanine DNA methyltransferase